MSSVARGWFAAPIAALAFFVALNAALPLVLRARYDIGYEGRVSAGFASLDPLSVDDMLALADRVGGRKVFWIGDSIVHGRTPLGGDSPRLLEIELQQRYGPDVHVYNAALAAARTGDKYGVLLQVLAHHPSLVIVELKYLEFSRAQAESIPFRYPYLNPVVATDPAYAGRYQAFDRYAQPPLSPPSTGLAIAADMEMERLLSIARFRALLQDIAFGGDLFDRLGGAAPDPPILARDYVPPPPGPSDAPPADPRAPANFTGAYRSGPFDAFPNPGLFFLDRALTAIEASHVPAITYLAAINHTLVGTLASDALFNANVELIDRVIADHRVTFSDYDAALPDDSDFLDTEHLTTPGHVAMVHRLLADHPDVFDRAMGP